MNADLALWTNFSFARRYEMIEIAKKVALDYFGKVEFEGFQKITIEKKAVNYRVRFQAIANTAAGDKAKNSSFSVHISPTGSKVEPSDDKQNSLIGKSDFAKDMQGHKHPRPVANKLHTPSGIAGDGEWVKIKEDERPRKKGEGHYLEVFNFAKPNEMIHLAKGLAQRAYGNTDLLDFSIASVYKDAAAYENIGQFKVEFRAPYTNATQRSEDPTNPPGGGAKTSNTILVHISEGGVSVEPYKPEQLEKFPSDFRKIAALFEPNDSLSIKEHSEHFEVSASRIGGGAEGYTINKKTFEKKMTWHEHPEPNRTNDDSELVQYPSSLVEEKTKKPAPEQWIKISD